MDKFLNKNKNKKEEETTAAYSYYSNLLNKPFSTVEALVEAETAFKEAKAKEEAATVAKRNAAMVVNNSIDLYEEGKVTCNKAIAAAYNEYKAKVAEAEKALNELQKDASEKLNKWLEEHPGQGFHYTYKSKDGKIAREYNYYAKRYDVFDSYDKFARLLKDLWF